jgi:phage tail sheath gpL-like
MATITFNTVPSNALASGIFIEQQPGPVNVASLNIPQAIAVLGQVTGGLTPTWNQPQLITSVAQAITLYGAGSQLHMLINTVMAGCGSVPVYAFPIQDGAGAAATGTITVSGGPATAAGTIALYIAGKRVPVSVSVGDTATVVGTNITAAINAGLLYSGAPAGSLPISASGTTTITLTARWKGLTGNNISVTKDLGSTDAAFEPVGITLSLPATLSAGTVDPDPSVAMGNFGSRWYTWMVYPYQQSTALTSLTSAYNARMGSGVKMPFIGVIGSVLDYAAFISLVNPLNTPYVYYPVQGSPNLPEEISASVVGVCAASAQADPYRPLKGIMLPNIMQGNSSTITQWSWATKQTVELAGGAVSDLHPDGTVWTGDMITTYKTNSQSALDPSWQYAEAICNVQAKIYSLQAMFSSPPYDRAIVVSDASISNKQYVVSPKTVKAAIINLLDNNWLINAGSQNRASIVGSLVAQINSGNPGRIDVNFVDNFSAGLRIIAVAYQWSFFPVGQAI